MRLYKLLIQMDAFGAHPFLIIMRAVYGAAGNEWKVKGMDLGTNTEYETETVKGDDPYKAIRAWIARQIDIQNGAILSYKEVKL